MESSVRKNTLKLCFESGVKVPSHLEVLRFITGNLKLSAADLHSVYKDENDGHFFIKFMDEGKFNEFCKHVEEVYAFKYDDGSTTPVCLDMASRIFRYVRIFNLPPEIEDRLIAQVMGQFGTVRQQVKERYPAEYNLSVFSGVRGVHMEIAKEIPANIFIGHFRARIYYSGSESLESTNLERAKTEEKMQPMDEDSKQGQKRVATSTPSSQLVDSSTSEEGGVTDAEGSFRTMKSKRNKGQQKVIETISNRKQSKKNK